MKKIFSILSFLLLLLGASFVVESEEILNPGKVYKRYERSIVQKVISEKKGILFVHVRGQDKGRSSSREYANQKLKALEKLSGYISKLAGLELSEKIRYKLSGLQVVSRHIEDGEVSLTLAVPMSEVRNQVERLSQSVK